MAENLTERQSSGRGGLDSYLCPGGIAQLFESAPVGVVLVGADGCIAAVNPAARGILGRAGSELCGMSLDHSPWTVLRSDGSVMPAEEYPALIACRSGRMVSGVMMGIADASGEGRRWLKVHAVPLIAPGESPPCNTWVFFDDVTTLKQAEVREQWRNRSLELVARGAPLKDIFEAIVRDVEAEEATAVCTILVLDGTGKHLLTGAAPGMPEFFNRAVNGVEIGVGVGSCGTAAATGQRVVVEDVFHHPYWAPYLDLASRAGLGACWSEPIRSSRGRVLGTFAIYHSRPCAPTQEDISRIESAANLVAIAIEHAEALKELEHQARTDYLTGLDNRRHFWELAEAEVARVLRYGGELSLLMLDVDRFKGINDHWGHKVGDLVLQSLSATCRACLREVDILGRLGGEEFGVLLPETDGLKAVEVAERLRQAIAASPVALPQGESVSYTVSIGVTTLDGQNTDLETLFGQADRALYEAKGRGRNQVCASPAVAWPCCQAGESGGNSQ